MAEDYKLSSNLVLKLTNWKYNFRLIGLSVSIILSVFAIFSHIFPEADYYDKYIPHFLAIFFVWALIGQLSKFNTIIISENYLVLKSSLWLKKTILVNSITSYKKMQIKLHPFDKTIHLGVILTIEDTDIFLDVFEKENLSPLIKFLDDKAIQCAGEVWKDDYSVGRDW